MIIIMNPKARRSDVEAVVKTVREHHLEAYTTRWGDAETIIVEKNDSGLLQQLRTMQGVKSVAPVEEPYQLASRAFKKDDTVVCVGDGVEVGGEAITVIAGPCAIESREQLSQAAKAVSAGGASILRGGAFKPRTSPYSFQGLGEEGLKMLREIGTEVNLPTVTEAMSPEDVGLVVKYADIVQLGARNMHNFPLLKEVGQCRKPVFLKRGMNATVEEWLLSAEYILLHGNSQVVLCERGIRTFERATRNTLDLSSIPVCKKLSHLPIIADPSHATGRRDLIRPMARAAIAAGADGVMVEVHPDPERALCDGPQSIPLNQFEGLMAELERVATAVGRRMPRRRGV